MGESLVRECWRWKDSALGDGRDYFVPRPRALRAFHSLFVGMDISVEVTIGVVNKNQVADGDNCDGESHHRSSSPSEVVLKLPSIEGGQCAAVEVRLPLSQCLNGDSYAFTNSGDMLQSSGDCSFSVTFVVDECVALSNCARFDVILVLKRSQQAKDHDNTFIQCNTKEIEEVAARYAVAYHLQQQIASQRSKSTSLLERAGLASWLDLPGAINLETAGPGSSNSFKEEDWGREVHRLARRLTSMEGAHSISTHLSLIAGGLAPRPNRPDREVIFRPYSSRDAHILLQLKRTVEVVSVLDTKDDWKGGKRGMNANGGGGGRGRIKTLLDGALSAGKAARNKDVVPDIEKLKEYGSDGTPPAALANIVAEVSDMRYCIEVLCMRYSVNS